MRAAVGIPGPPTYRIKGPSPKTELTANPCLQKRNMCRSDRLLFGALSKRIHVTLLWLESNNFSRLPETSKCSSTTEREISIIGANIEYPREARECQLQPRIEFVFVEPKRLSHRITWLHNDDSSAKWPSQNPHRSGSIRKQRCKKRDNAPSFSCAVHGAFRSKQSRRTTLRAARRMRSRLHSGNPLLRLLTRHLRPVAATSFTTSISRSRSLLN